MTKEQQAAENELQKMTLYNVFYNLYESADEMFAVVPEKEKEAMSWENDLKRASDCLTELQETLDNIPMPEHIE